MKDLRSVVDQLKKERDKLNRGAPYEACPFVLSVG